MAVDARALEWLLLGTFVVARTAVSTALISRPGLQYDETLFVNAATLRVPGDFLLHSVGGVPVMVFPYIGALKSWLYYPLFKVFGTSPVVIRLPVILIVSAGLVLLYLAVRGLVNRPVAILAFTGLCFDNSVLWLTRDDVGPSALEFFLKCAALFCIFRFARAAAAAGDAGESRAGSERWLLALLAVLALGVFNKLNFIWTVNATAAVSLLVLARYRALLSAFRRAAAIWFAGLAAIYSGFGAYYLGDHIGSVVAGSGHGSIGQPLSTFANGTEAILSGTWFYSYALAPLSSRGVVVVVILAFVLCGAIASVAFTSTRSLAVAGLALGVLLIAAQNLLTSAATAGWHYISIYPFVTAVGAYGAYVLTRAVLHHNRYVYIALGCIGAGTLAYNGVLIAKYLRTLSSREPTNAAWSPAVYRLSQKLQRSDSEIVTADWGISNPLFALHPSRRYSELAFLLGTPTSGSLSHARQLLSSTPEPKLVVTHANDKLIFRPANANLFRALGTRLRFVGTIDGRDGKPVYQTYLYK